jgi:hypothetical protein
MLPQILLKPREYFPFPLNLGVCVGFWLLIAIHQIFISLSSPLSAHIYSCTRLQAHTVYSAKWHANISHQQVQAKRPWPCLYPQCSEGAAEEADHCTQWQWQLISRECQTNTTLNFCMHLWATFSTCQVLEKYHFIQEVFDWVLGKVET